MEILTYQHRKQEINSTEICDEMIESCLQFSISQIYQNGQAIGEGTQNTSQRCHWDAQVSYPFVIIFTGI